MAGTLIVNDKSDWLPAGWLYDGVLEYLEGGVSASDPALAQFLRDARTDRGGYCDLRKLEGARFRLLTEAADRAYAAAVSKGGAAVKDQRFSAGYLKHFAALCALLQADPRSGH